VSFVEKIDRFLVGRIAFPASNYLLNRKNILGNYRKLLLAEQYSKEALREVQLHKLVAIVRHIYKWVPFYTQRFKEIGLAPEDIKKLEDARWIPPLIREDLIEHRLDLVDFRYRQSALDADKAAHAGGLPISAALFRRHWLIRNGSSGSTGTPTVFYEDGSTTALNWAHELRLKHWFGLSPGAKEARMSATSTEYAGKSKLPSAREWLWNQMILPGYFLSDREYELSLRKIQKFRPRILWGPTSALTGLAQYVQRRNEDISAFRPDLVISRAAPVYAHEKKLLTRVFGCPVTNIYGSRELGHIAMDCPHGSTHLNQENYLVELEDVANDRAGAGQGNILVTPLFQSPMAFFRYRIGDIAELGGSDCSCGRPQTVVKKIMGRAGEVFKLQDGRLIEPNFWCIAFEGNRLSQNVERFQVIYRRNNCIRFRIVRRPGYSAETEAQLQKFLEQNFPPSMRFEFEYVQEIKPQPSGKYPVVVNEIEQPERQLVEV